MCRMVVFKGENNFGIELIKSLKKAAKNDIFNNFTSHKDGWGGIILDEKKELLIKSTIPIYNENVESLFVYSNIYGLFHARFAAPKEPIIGPIDSHPFIIHGDNEIVYIAHNGWINKKIIGEEFKINYEFKNDTEVFAQLIEKFDGNIKERIIKAIKFTNEHALLGALNLLCIISKYDNKKEICYYSKSKENDIYIRLFKYEKNGNFAVMSSSVAFEMGFIDENGKKLNSFTEEVPQNVLFLNGKVW